jgi:hypothetical protein
MKKFGAMLAIVMALSIAACLPPASVDIGLSVPLPPPIVFSAPPEMVILPETEVYVAPEYDQDLFFYGGWWWRPWGGRWYRSLNYDSGWEFYHGVPGWYGGVYPHWRDNYRNHMWGGQRWDYRPVHQSDVRANWKTWHDTGRHQQNWGTTGSYRHGAETRRDFRGFPQETRSQQGPVATRQAPAETRGQRAPAATHQAPAETRGQQAPVATRQAPAETRGQQAPVATRQAPDLSKNKSAFGGVGRGSDAQKQSNRGSQSRQSMSSKGTGGVGQGNVGHGGGSGGGSKGDVGRPR